MSDKSINSIVPLFVSIAALGLAMLALIRVESEPAAGRQSENSGPEEVLTKRLDAMHRQIEQHRQQLEVRLAAAETAPQSLELQDLAEQVTIDLFALEERLAEIDAALNELDQIRQIMVERSVIPPSDADVVHFTQHALNEESSAQEKLTALRALRRADARTPDVVEAMVTLWNETDDGRIRADIFRQLEGVTDPVLLEPLLNGILGDSVPDVREEAAETLGGYLPDPTVEEVLRYSAENDDNEGVRRQALRSLERVERPLLEPQP